MPQVMFPRLLPAVFASVLASSVVSAQGPPGYYASVDTGNPTNLRATLHAVIDDHTRLPYTSFSTDTWDCLEAAQQDPANAAMVLDIYRNRSFLKQGGGNSLYNREHSWPKSYGFPDDDGLNVPFTDCHILQLCDDAYNTARSNKPFRNCSAACSEYVTDVNGGQGGGAGSYPGNSNWSSGSFTNGTWEVWLGRRGDVARAMFYCDVRYEGGTHGITGTSEPDLILTNNTTLIDSSNTGSNESVGYMGLLTVLLQWHAQDPVDDFERQRNNVVFAFQGNRNPFVDHPEWVDCLFNGACTPPGPGFCHGDGGNQVGCTPCPCMNSAPQGTLGGCRNSAGTSAYLYQLGTPSAAADTLRFEITAANPNTFAVLISGDNKLPTASACAPGAGVLSSVLDGLRCVGGGVLRHGARGSDIDGDVGVTTNGWGPPNGPSGGLIASAGFVAGQTRNFQGFYREDLGEGCATGQNTTNGVEVLVLP